LPGAKSTDDTEFALLTARMLLDCGGALTSEAVLHAWRKYILSEGGVFDRAGRPLYGAVANLERGIEPPLSGLDNVGNDDDGAAMRITPIGIICAGEPERAAEMARIEAEISHARDGIWAAQAVAASIAVAMVDGNVEEIIDAGLNQIPDDSWLGRAMARTLKICDGVTNIQDAWAVLHTELWTPVHSTAAEAIPQAYALFRLTGGEFRQGLFWAGNFGRDADTIAAVVGALSGARQGLGVIPPEWVEMVRHPGGVALRFAAKEDVLALAKDLARLVRE
ncbi:MAG: ADP-ribosylglycohydrolase family protein, partial [Anaerolineales bacterium]|nr:ADP-ribosylglycohydrolase family protein [Anaerolineales bacterium]